MARAVVTVGEFPNAMLAELARGRLEEEGIEAEVSGALTQSWAGGEVPMSGVKVEVLREDFERARAILDEVESHLREGAGAEADVEDEAEEADDAESTAEAAEAAADGVWSVERTGRALAIALLVTLLSWVFLPLLAVALALVARILIRRGAAPWTPWMRTVFVATLVVAAALGAYSAYVLYERAEWWLVPWPWFHTEQPWGTPDS